MSTEYTFEEMVRMGETNKKVVRKFRFSKTTKPRSVAKNFALFKLRVNWLVNNMPRICNDGYWRYPDEIARLESEGIRDASSMPKLPCKLEITKEDWLNVLRG